MERIIRQSIGIDVAQKKLDITLGKIDESLNLFLFSKTAVENNEKGFKKLLEIVDSFLEKGIKTRYVMEATGVYHEKLAYFLHENNCSVSIVLPNKISSFMRTLTVKTITDKSCADAIARFGLERNLDDWHPPKDIYRNMRQLTRERDQLVSERSAIKNQLHAEEKEALPNNRILKRIKSRIKFLNKQEAEIKKDLDQIVKQNLEVKNEVKYMSSVPGVGSLTAMIILAETNGFELISNTKQLASYAGFDVKEKQSGTSIKGTSRISKKGNRHLRSAMYLPSLCSIRFNLTHRDLFCRIVQRHGVKKKALVAVQRRILELTYKLCKNKCMFDPEYEIKKSSEQSKLLATQTG